VHRSRNIGKAMLARALRDHTYALRAAEVDAILHEAVTTRNRREAQVSAAD
jgi:hypothetical protein